jgi:hypothetical protein
MDNRVGRERQYGARAAHRPFPKGAGRYVARRAPMAKFLWHVSYLEASAISLAVGASGAPRVNVGYRPPGA